MSAGLLDKSIGIAIAMAAGEVAGGWLEESHSFITALTPHLGYERSSALVKQSIKENKNLRQLILDSGILTADNLEAIFTPGELTRPGIAGAKFMKKEGGA